MDINRGKTDVKVMIMVKVLVRCWSWSTPVGDPTVLKVTGSSVFTLLYVGVDGWM